MREHNIKLIGIKIIPAFLFSSNPNEMIKWQFNCCRQTAFLLAGLLRDINIKAEIWEGTFTYLLDTNYKHAYVWCPEDMILIASKSLEYYYEFCTENNPSLVVPGLVMHSKEQLNYEQMLEEKEYFTKMQGKYLLASLKNIVRLANIKL